MLLNNLDLDVSRSHKLLRRRTSEQHFRARVFVDRQISDDRPALRAIHRQLYDRGLGTADGGIIVVHNGVPWEVTGSVACVSWEQKKAKHGYFWYSVRDWR